MGTYGQAEAAVVTSACVQDTRSSIETERETALRAVAIPDINSTQCT